MKFGTCARCGKPKPLTRDHIIPKNKGGTNDPSNIQFLCWPCHNMKNKLEDDPNISCPHSELEKSSYVHTFDAQVPGGGKVKKTEKVTVMRCKKCHNHVRGA